MYHQFSRLGNRWLALLCAIALSGGMLMVTAAFPPQQEDQERRIWDSEFLQKRPTAKTSPAQSSNKTIKYKRVSPAPTAKNADGAAINVGVTVWRLRPATTSDDQATRILEREDDNSSNNEWMPERIDAQTPLVEGQRVRFSVEVPRSGYLYVVDREQYADGTYGDPYLIFPVQRARGLENNRVQAGSTIEVPAQEDKHPYFLVKRSRPDQVSDVLTLIVSPEPLADITIGRKILKLSVDQFSLWEKQWGTQVEIHELVDGAGKTYTREEKAAGARTRDLTQNDPLPQTIYRVSTKPKNPVMVDVPLKIGK
ncbi:MAG: DUF4384 domain-containing protein [Blastocatellia bacterium]|nr:DUF4384 domain-containing protein [Blastocatellia bacterium]